MMMMMIEEVWFKVILLQVLGIGTWYRQNMAATTRYSAKNHTRYTPRWWTTS